MPVVVPPPKKVMLKTTLEVALMTVLALPMIYIHVIIDEFPPYQRGFYCNDETLRHPYKEEQTVPMGTCFMIWFVSGLIIIIGVDCFAWSCRSNAREKLIICGFDIPLIVAELYRSLGFMIFGAATAFLFTDLSKFTIGRLRPHFLTVCKPDMSDGGPCKDDTGLYVFMSGNDSDCQSLNGLEGEELQEQTKILHEARLSFMSGHSSFSFFCAMYLVIFLQLRVNKLPETGSTMKNLIRLLLKVVTPYLQFGLLILAFFIALSRVSDYFHHPLDVLTGSVVGIIFAFWAIYVSGMASKETAFWKKTGRRPKSTFVQDDGLNPKQSHQSDVTIEKFQLR